MQELKTILCPIDFTRVSDREMQLAAQLSERTGARLVLLHSIDEAPPAYLGNVWMYEETHPGTQPDAENRLKEALARLAPGVRARAEGKISHGALADSILYLARELPADLIVMGTHDRKGPEHTSHTDRIVLQSPCPVLAVRESAEQPVMPQLPALPEAPLRVLVPMDFSAHSVHALEYARGLSRYFPLEVHVLHVESPLSWNDLKGVPPPSIAEGRRARLRESKERLQALIPAQLDCPVSVHARLGSPVEEIVTFAQEMKVSLVIMGVHAKGILDKLLFGATSKGVLHQSPCPVWLVPTTHGNRTARAAGV